MKKRLLSSIAKKNAILTIGIPTPSSNIRPIRYEISAKDGIDPKDVAYFKQLEQVWAAQHNFWAWNNDRFERKRKAWMLDLGIKEDDGVLDESDPRLIPMYQEYLIEHDEMFREYQKFWLSQAFSLLKPAFFYNMRRLWKKIGKKLEKNG